MRVQRPGVVLALALLLGVSGRRRGREAMKARVPPTNLRTIGAVSSGGLIAGACTILAVAAVLSLSVGPTGITLTALPRVLGAIATGTADATTGDAFEPEPG